MDKVSRRRQIHRARMAARREEQRERKTGMLHVERTKGSIHYNEANQTWEERTTQPKPSKAQRLSQQQLAKLEALRRE